jgi:hypothetical protein
LQVVVGLLEKPLVVVLRLVAGPAVLELLPALLVAELMLKRR